MKTGAEIDGVLVQWGERLFYPSNRIVRSSTPRLSGSLVQRAAAIRRRIEATVIRRAPQVMVKVTGGGRGMGAIAAHFRYISKNGRLPFEDDRGVTRDGREALHDLVEQWRFGGAYIDETTQRREAFNIMLSMPRATDALLVQRAAREFAQAELADHRYVMVLHDHQANPHVHLSVRAESRHGKRLNPRKADLQRWRETFAEKLRGWGIDAEATRQRTRGQVRNYEPLWQLKAAEEGRLKTTWRIAKSGLRVDQSLASAAEAWRRIAEGLSRSDSDEDRDLAVHVDRFIARMPSEVSRGRDSDRGREVQSPTREVRPQSPAPALAREGPTNTR
ncbi:MAG: relaxase/mobilization nuclease domain-containing protein [Burkholderiales bacterium]|nr:relaxase/mobilization nuclease domain-containing protein [Burkholderiales bacterium]